MDDIEGDIRALAAPAPQRHDFWASFLSRVEASTVAELGVYRGDFAVRLLDACPSIERYYMVDPWRHLDDWNKPANKTDDAFEGYYQEVLAKTARHAAKRVVLRGRTVEVVSQIEDDSLDFAYVDGDHTLRGITTDLVQIYPKVREGCWLGGDDFCRSIFQHSREFEPTLVFPFAVYFAEAVGARIFALPRKQFVMQKVMGGEFAFVDLTGRYSRLTLKDQLAGVAGVGVADREAAEFEASDLEATEFAPAAPDAASRSGVDPTRPAWPEPSPPVHAPDPAPGRPGRRFGRRGRRRG